MILQLVRPSVCQKLASLTTDKGPKDDADQPAQQPENDGPENAPAKVVDHKAEPDRRRDTADEQEQESVDDEGEQPERQNIKRKGDDADEVADHSIDDSED